MKFVSLLILLIGGTADAIFCPWNIGTTLCSDQSCHSSDVIMIIDSPTTSQCAEACIETTKCTAAVWYSSNRCSLKRGGTLLEVSDPFHKFGADGKHDGRGAQFDKLLQRCGEEGSAEECRIVASVRVKECKLNL